MASPFSWDEFGERGVSTDSNNYCEPCWTSYRDKGIKYAFCEDCYTNLCKNCYDLHHRFKLTRAHRVEIFQKGSYARCQNHTGQCLSLLCLNHLECICEDGLKDSHTKCHVKSFDALKYVKRNETEMVVKQVRQMQKEIIEARQHKVKDVTAQQEYALKLNRDYWHRIQIQINRSKRKSKKEVYEAFNKEVQQTYDTANKAIEVLNKLENPMNIAGHRQVLCLDELPSQIAEFKQFSKKIHEPVTAFNVPDYLTSFERHVSNLNCQARQSVDGLDISSLSDSVDLETDSGFGSGNFYSYNDSILQSLNNLGALEEHGNIMAQVEGERDATKDVQNTTAEQTDPIYIKTGEDNGDCCITGIYVFDDGNILLADCYNKRIKLFSMYGDYITSVETPSEPFDVTVTETGDAAVSMWMNQKEIVMIDVRRNSLRIKGNIKLRNRIYGIVAIEDDFVISCDDKIPSVRRVNRSGETKWELSFGSDGRKVFKAPGYLVTKTTSYGNYILVSDTEMQRIAMIEAKTGMLAKVLPQSKTGPLGLTKDNSELVYVGYRYDAGIRVWSSDMDENKTILSSGNELKRPQAVAFNTFTGELLVSSWRCNAVERFKIFYT